MSTGIRQSMKGVMARSTGSVAALSLVVLRRQVRTVRLLESQSLAMLELQRASLTTLADAVVGWQQMQIDRLSSGSDS